MARYLSAEDAAAEHLEVLGPNLGPVYHQLWNEAAWLHLKWKQYVELYGVSEERIDILNESASLFFRIIQDALWEDILLQLSALTDGVALGKKENLTLRRLPFLIPDAEVRSRVQNAVDEVDAATLFARDWRNRRIAHRDLALALGSGAKPLIPASRVMVGAAVSKVCEVIRQVSLGCIGSDIGFLNLSEPGDAVSLLYVLRDGVEVERARRERLGRAQVGPEDLLPPRAL